MPIYNFDTTGTAVANLVTGEAHALSAGGDTYNIIVPSYAPYYGNSLSLVFVNSQGQTVPFTLGIDYYPTHPFVGAGLALSKPIFGSIEILNRAVTGTLTIRYQTLGGTWAVNVAQISQAQSDQLRNPRVTSWEQVQGLPNVFPVVDHVWDLVDMVGMSDVVTALNGLTAAVAARAAATPTQVIVPPPMSKRNLGLSNTPNAAIASSAAALAGVDNTTLLTPYLGQILVNKAINDYVSSLSASAMPTTGTWTKNTFVSNNQPAVTTVASGPLTGLKINIAGWRRLTTSASNVANADWATVIEIVQ